MDDAGIQSRIVGNNLDCRALREGDGLRIGRPGKLIRVSPVQAVVYGCASRRGIGADTHIYGCGAQSGGRIENSPISKGVDFHPGADIIVIADGLAGQPIVQICFEADPGGIGELNGTARSVDERVWVVGAWQAVIQGVI